MMIKNSWLLAVALILPLQVLPACSDDNDEDDSDNSGYSSTVEPDYFTDPIEAHTFTVSALDFMRDSLTVSGWVWRPGDVDGIVPVIVMSHGYGGTYADCEAYATELVVRGYACYAFDFCGGSESSESDGSLEDMSIFTEELDLKAVVDSMLLQDFVDTDELILFGIGQGGLVSAMVAADEADLFTGLVLLSPAFNIPSTASELISLLDGDLPEYYDYLGYRFYLAYYSELGSYDPYDEIGSFTGDVLIFHGDEDEVVDISWSEAAVECYTSAELYSLSGQGHNYDSSTVSEVIEDIYSFLYNL